MKKGLIALALVLAVVGIVWVVEFKKDSDLLDACQRCDAAEVERLLKNGADPNAQRKGTVGLRKTALIMAVSCDKETNASIGDPQVVKLLLEKGADVTKRTLGNYAALHFAVGQMPPDCEGGGPPRRWASGNSEVIRLLLASGADVNANLGQGYTPLSLAIRCNRECDNKDVVRLLIGHGATSSSGDKCEDMWVTSDCGLHDLIGLFIQRGCDANGNQDWPNKENPYPIVQLAARGHKDAVKRLLEVTPKVDEEIIAWAVYHNCMDLVKDLLDRGINVNYRSRWDSHLNEMLSPTRARSSIPIIYIAAAVGDVEMTDLLIERGADVNARGAAGTGWGALDVALSKGHYRVADVLRAHGAQQATPQRPEK